MHSCSLRPGPHLGRPDFAGEQGACPWQGKRLQSSCLRYEEGFSTYQVSSELYEEDICLSRLTRFTMKFCSTSARFSTLAVPVSPNLMKQCACAGSSESYVDCGPRCCRQVQLWAREAGILFHCTAIVSFHLYYLHLICRPWWPASETPPADTAATPALSHHK